MTICVRCKASTSSTIMSKFNLDIICIPCQQDETQAPGYKAADEAEVAAVRAGVRNFPGVGLSEQDREFLAACRLERESMRQKVRLLTDPAYTPRPRG